MSLILNLNLTTFAIWGEELYLCHTRESETEMNRPQSEKKNAFRLTLKNENHKYKYNKKETLEKIKKMIILLDKFPVNLENSYHPICGCSKDFFSRHLYGHNSAFV